MRGLVVGGVAGPCEVSLRKWRPIRPSRTNCKNGSTNNTLRREAMLQRGNSIFRLATVNLRPRRLKARSEQDAAIYLFDVVRNGLFFSDHLCLGRLCGQCKFGKSLSATVKHYCGNHAMKLKTVESTGKAPFDPLY